MDWQEYLKIDWKRFLLNLLFLFAIVFLLGAVVWFTFARPLQQHRDAYDRISHSVELLAAKRPADVPQDQWEYMILWTNNAVGNCCATSTYITDQQHFQSFADELEQRVKGEVSVETIDWIWDQLEQFSRYGKRYSDRYRPTRPERLHKSLPIQNETLTPNVE